MTHHLCELLGKEKVTSHHGSLSAKLRLDAENRLKRGELKALVATSSLELGIDIGSVELVCQLGSTRSIATFLQRVGRAEHRRGGLPKGRLFPLTRDELVECVATLRCIRNGELDALHIPEKPLDRAGATNRRLRRFRRLGGRATFRTGAGRVSVSRPDAEGICRSHPDAGGRFQHQTRPARGAAFITMP